VPGQPQSTTRTQPANLRRARRTPPADPQDPKPPQ
jgi:hypothetical protein